MGALEDALRMHTITILGIDYRVLEVDRVAAVDVNESAALSGQIDFRARTIRVHVGDRQAADVLRTLIHEVMHGIAEALQLETFGHGELTDQAHKDLDLMALGLTDVLLRNGGLPGWEFKGTRRPRTPRP